jgi:hypothetical protein
MEVFLAGLFTGVGLVLAFNYVRERQKAPVHEELESKQQEIAELQEQLGDYRKQLDEQEERLALAAKVFRGECELLIAASGARSATLFALDVPTGHPRRGVVSTTALAVVENAPLVLSHWARQCDSALQALNVATPKARKGAARQQQALPAVPAAQQVQQTAVLPNGMTAEALKDGQVKVHLPDGRIMLVNPNTQTVRVYPAKKQGGVQ